MSCLADVQSKTLAEIRGQRMNVPPLEPLFSNWRQGVNPSCGELIPILKEVLMKFAPDEEHLNHARASDFSILVSSWYPSCSLERLQVLGIFAAWLFLWDDKVDRQEASCEPELANDIGMGTQYRSEAKANKRIVCWDVFPLPTAIGECVWAPLPYIHAVLPFRNEGLLGRGKHEHDSGDGTITTLLPIYMREAGINLDQAVNRVVEELEECCVRFNEAAAALRKRASGYGSNVQNDVERVIECFETLQSGGHNWSLQCRRYDMAQYVQKDGSLSIML
ncbi:hypothetical protein B0I35DRAFT_404864 [Stachybotrys elegans]|uniref:Terpene synthase n=1 Tax=Stachybotrys elegans TaxID=80388 RepID=A0A8K0T0W9_9HYPO|nr:hypothetical protein B0I35DRAFT_404864 [Stachybotrys elegans]